jgi:acyl-CoA thioesterase
VDENKARADFESALASHQPVFGQFFLSKLLNLDIAYGEQDCTVTFTPSDWMFNPQGTLHGGIIATVLDISMGHCLHNVAGKGVTLEMKMQYLRAGGDSQLVTRAGFLRRGRSICFLEARMADAHDRAVAMATSTWQIVAPPAAGGTP